MYVDPEEFGYMKAKVEAIEKQQGLDSVKLNEVHEYVTRQRGAATTVTALATTIASAAAIASGWFFSK